MIDFHTHIIPNIDDGSSSLEESVALIQSLKSQGVTRVVLTSHYYFETSVDDFLKIRDEKIALLKEAIGDEMLLIPACEVHLTKHSNIDEICNLKIENTNYILVELPSKNTIDMAILEVLENIIDYLGLTPIIAHVERYPFVKKQPAITSVFNSMGCILQLNTSSLFKVHAKNLAFTLIRKNQIKLLGTDCHNMRNRPPVYLPAINKLNSKLGSKVVAQLMKNGEDVLNNKKTDSLEFKTVKKLFKHYV